MSTRAIEKTHLPEWFRVRRHTGARYRTISNLCKQQGLHTVCEEAKCPNIWECWNSGTATFMILGRACTRACTFCGVPMARHPLPVDPEEPRKVAEALTRLGLDWAVLTSVTRDDLADSGASVFAACVEQIHRLQPSCGVEVLIPDFKGETRALDLVIESGPQVAAHNVETVPRLYSEVRPQADYRRSLEVLDYLSRKSGGKYVVKSSLMVGLGETEQEIHEVISNLAASGCRAMTLGQYLSPSRKHHPVARFYEPDQFDRLADIALTAGISRVAAGPLVRSSYQAHRLAGRQLHG
ncbi:MAG: lipoyl synthase [Gemmatimonadota bacterium]|nr:lipoyl synthase [Gemmatimonadota bacterium]